MNQYNWELRDAIIAGDYEAVEEAIDQGADVNFRYTDGKGSALHIACLNGRTEIAEVLIAHGADVHLKNKDLKEVPLHLAAKSGKADLVRLLLAHGANLDEKNLNGRKALRYASVNGDVETLQALVDAGVSVAEDSVALCDAAIWNHLEACRFLLDHGANIHVKDAGGGTALHSCVIKAWHELFRLLIDRGADPFAVDERGRTMVHVALRRKRPEFAEWLLNRGVNPLAVDNFSDTLLHCAAFGGNIEAAERLIDDGCSLHALNAYDHTPLHEAVNGKSLAMCQFLVRSGAKSSYVPDNAKEEYLTPFQYAVRFGSPDIVRYFVLQCGEDMAQRTLANRTLAQLAAQNKVVKEALRSLKTEAAVSSGIAAGGGDAAPTGQRRAGMAPL